MFIGREKDDTLKLYDLHETVSGEITGAAAALFSNLQKAEERAEKEGWVDAETLEREL